MGAIARHVKTALKNLMKVIRDPNEIVKNKVYQAMIKCASSSSGTPKRFAIAELLGETHKWTYCALIRDRISVPLARI